MKKKVANKALKPAISAVMPHAGAGLARRHRAPLAFVEKRWPKLITMPSGGPNAVAMALLFLVSRVPTSNAPVSLDPKTRARATARSAAMRAAAISGALALPPGPLGMATILPDLLAIWRLQGSMVAEIAAAFGKSAFLRKETLIYCLFKHGSAAVARDLVARVGERYLIRRGALSAIQQMLQKVGVTVTQRTIGKGISRWLPVVGAFGVGAYAYYDTVRVAEAAIELFSNDIEIEDSEEKMADPGR